MFHAFLAIIVFCVFLAAFAAFFGVAIGFLSVLAQALCRCARFCFYFARSLFTGSYKTYITSYSDPYRSYTPIPYPPPEKRFLP